MKKTIFILIKGRQQARNILRTDVFTTLCAQRDVRLVFFSSPPYKIDAYKKEFGLPNVIFEGISEMPHFHSVLDAFFGRLSLSYIDSLEARALRKEWLLFGRRQPFRYLISRFLLMVFGNVRWLRQFVRFLDYNLVKDDRFAQFFDIYKPDIVFSSRIDLQLDRSFLRHAKKRKVKTIGMVYSWDNITLAKYPFRVLPDKLIVHNDILKKNAITFLDTKAENIHVSGMPHFDHYVLSFRSTREAFCKKIGIKPSKRIILFASNAVGSPYEWQILSMLDDAIVDGRLPNDLIFLVRHHPARGMDLDELKPSKHIFFDDSKTYLTNEKVYTEILKRDMDHLADTLFHSAVTINHGSTMSIDAAAFDKPVINPVFDGWEEKTFYESVRRYYVPSHVHYYHIVKSGGVRLAYSIDELILYINTYLEDPTLDAEGRKRIVREQCYKLDGRAGIRIAEFVLSEL